MFRRVKIIQMQREYGYNSEIKENKFESVNLKLYWKKKIILLDHHSQNNSMILICNIILTNW